MNARLFLLISMSFVVVSCARKMRNDFVYITNHSGHDLYIRYKYTNIFSTDAYLYTIPVKKENDAQSVMFYDPLFCGRCEIKHDTSGHVIIKLPIDDSVAVQQTIQPPGLEIILAGLTIDTNPKVPSNIDVFPFVKELKRIPFETHEKYNDYNMVINDSHFYEKVDTVLFFPFNDVNPSPEKDDFYKIYRGEDDTIHCFKKDFINHPSGTSYTLSHQTTYYKGVETPLNDTVIDNRHYEVVRRYKSGQPKLIGKYEGYNKQGIFTTYDKEGNQIKSVLYCQDKRMNKKILGLKQGAWGNCSGLRKKYFLGIKIAQYPFDPAPSL